MLKSLVLAGCAAAATADDKHKQPYIYAEVDGRGPSNWGKFKGSDGKVKYDVCESGKRQSPVNLHQAVVDTGLKPHELHYEVASGVTLTNNQHSVDLIPKNNPNYLLDPNQGNKRYNLLGIHFHTPSEHAIGHGLYDMEMHMVHKEADPAEPGEPLLVLGTMFDAGSAPNDAFAWFADLPTVPMAGFDNVADMDAEYDYKTADLPKAQFDFEGVLTGKTFFNYKGSLTTPGCDEAVMWYVMTEVNAISKAQLDAFRTAMGFDAELEEVERLHPGYKLAPFQVYGNNRPTQPLHGRTIKVSTDFAKYPTTTVDPTPGALTIDVDTDDDLSGGEIAGIVLGSVALFCALVAGGLAMASKKPSGAAPTEPVAEKA